MYYPVKTAPILELVKKNNCVIFLIDITGNMSFSLFWNVFTLIFSLQKLRMRKISEENFYRKNIYIWQHTKIINVFFFLSGLDKNCIVYRF